MKTEQVKFPCTGLAGINVFSFKTSNYWN